MKLVTDIAGGAGDLGTRVRRGFGGFTAPTKDSPPRDTTDDGGTNGGTDGTNA